MGAVAEKLEAGLPTSFILGAFQDGHFERWRASFMMPGSARPTADTLGGLRWTGAARPECGSPIARGPAHARPDDAPSGMGDARSLRRADGRSAPLRIVRLPVIGDRAQRDSRGERRQRRRVHGVEGKVTGAKARGPGVWGPGPGLGTATTCADRTPLLDHPVGATQRRPVVDGLARRQISVAGQRSSPMYSISFVLRTRASRRVVGPPPRREGRGSAGVAPWPSRAHSASTPRRRHAGATRLR